MTYKKKNRGIRLPKTLGEAFAVGTPQIHRKQDRIPAWESGVSKSKKGWSSQANTHTAFDELLKLFLANRDKEGIKKNSRTLYERNIGDKFLGWLSEERKRRFWQQVTPVDVQDFVIHLRKGDYAEATVNQILRCMKTFFRWMKNDPIAEELELRQYASSLPKIPKNPGRVWIPTPVELQSFLASFDQDVIWGFRDYVIASLILDCGARIGEVCNLTIQDIKFEMNILRITNAEGNKTGERFVPIDPDVTVPMLRKWLRVRDNYVKKDSKAANHVFLTRNGGKCTNNAIGHEFAKQRKRLGMSGTKEVITPHVLRHYFCTYYLVNGGALHNLQVITGHTELETLMIYVHMARELSSVKEEHKRVSPLKNLAANSGKMGAKKTRKMF